MLRGEEGVSWEWKEQCARGQQLLWDLTSQTLRNCGLHNATDQQVLATLLGGPSSEPGGPPATWWVTPADTIVTAVRECDTLSRVPNLRLLEPILRPDTLLAVAPERVARLWPAEVSDAVADAGFNAYLRSRYDRPQLTAIELAATHVARPPSEAPGDLIEEVGGKSCLPFTLIQVRERLLVLVRVS